MKTNEEIQALTNKDATRLMTITRLSDSLTLNLYDDFYQSILYNRMEGVDTIGESKNTYTEEYADAEQLRIYMPDGDVYNKATDIKLTLVFVGINRSAIKDTFINFIKKGKFRYTDGVRERTFDFVFLKSSEPKEDIYKGNTPYMEITFELQNISGKTNPIEYTHAINYNGSLPSGVSVGMVARSSSNKLYARAMVGETADWVEMSKVDKTIATNASNFAYDPFTTVFTYTSGSTTVSYRYAGGQLIEIV